MGYNTYRAVPFPDSAHTYRVNIYNISLKKGRLLQELFLLSRPFFKWSGAFQHALQCQIRFFGR